MKKEKQHPGPKPKTLLFFFHSSKIRTHFISQTGQPVQKFGVVTEHFIILRILINNVMVHFAPAFLEQGSALDLDRKSVV